VLFADDFEGGLIPSVGTWTLIGPSVTVTNATAPPEPGPAEGAAYGHEAWVDRSPNPVCVWRSRIVLTRYEIDDAPPDARGLIRQRVHDGTHRGTDGAVASRINALVLNTALAAGTGRCPDWAPI
jgi:hypothetical protein